MRCVALDASAAHIERGLSRDQLAAEVGVSPGLIQTSAYAEAFFKATRPELSAAEVSGLVEVQLHRQRPDHDGRTVDLILDESVLLRSIASPQVMADQLAHLLTVDNELSVTLRVIRLGAAQPALSPSFTLLSLPGIADSAIRCLESRRAADVKIMNAVFDTLATCVLSPTRSTKLIEKYAGSYA